MRSLIFLILIFINYTFSIHLTEDEIRQIYETYVEPNDKDDLYRYSKLPMEKNTPFWPWENKDLPRVIAVLEFERFVKENNITCQKGLAINGIDPEWRYIPNDKLFRMDYLSNPIDHDLHTLDLPIKDFDFVMINQTLEHIYDPIRCLENVYKHMKTNGVLYINAPGNTILHDTPLHYYIGFTPVGLGTLVRAAGFKILKIGSWGNSDYLQLMHKTNSWPDYRQFKYTIKN